MVAQAQKIEVTADLVTFSFSPSQSALRGHFDQNRVWLESTAAKIAGRKVRMTAVQLESAPPASDDAAVRKTALRDQEIFESGTALQS